MNGRPIQLGWLRVCCFAAMLPSCFVGTAVVVQAADLPEVEAGRAVFHGKGNCTVCHTIGRGKDDKRARGPDLSGIGGRAAQRAKQFGLQGPDAGIRYLIHSIIRPGAEVVEGYNPAPESWLPSGLTDDDLRNLVVYLQSLGGRQKPGNVSLPPEWLAAKRQDYQRELSLFSIGDPTNGRKLIHDAGGKAGCIKCHAIDGQGNKVCPDLTTLNRVQRPSYILHSILDSSAFLVRGYRQVIIVDEDGVIHTGLPVSEDKQTITLVTDQEGKKTEVIQKDEIELMKVSKVSQMPGNFKEVLTAKQVMDVVAYLLNHERLAAAELAAKAKPATGGAKILAAPSLEVFGRLTDDQQRYRMAMERGDPVLGGRIYAHYCIMCHGTKGDGNGFNAVNLKTKPANHTDNRRMSKTEDILLHGVITRGGMKTGRSFLMPPWGGTLSERDRWDLVAFLRTLHADVKP